MEDSQVDGDQTISGHNLSTPAEPKLTEQVHHDLRIVSKFWGDEDDTDEETELENIANSPKSGGFTVVVSKSQRKKMKKKNKTQLDIKKRRAHSRAGPPLNFA